MDAAERRTLMDQGRQAFLAGQFYEAHELWEAVWDVIDDPDRTWIQGLIQIATGLHKLSRGRSDVTVTLFKKALKKLFDAPPALDGMDLDLVRADAAAVLAAIERGERPLPSQVRLRSRA
ncbi:MAG TPA: DUF309 domain-containing protein [Polyangia bacterium]|nr:DUF309 domain-containing protein [Polyangia bacterium]